MVPILKFDPFADAVLADPYAYHADLRDAGPVVWLEPHSCFASGRFAEVRQSLLDHETFISSRGVGLADFAVEMPYRPPSLLLETDPPLHDRMRGLMNKITSLPRLLQISTQWASIAQELVRSLVDAGPIDAVETIAQEFPLRVFPDLIGVREGGREHLIPYATAAFNAFGPRNRLFEQSMERAAVASEWVAESCKRKHLKPGGWGSQVFEAADQGACTETEAERLVRSFLAAGVDTTVNGIGNLIHCLSLHPDQWNLLKGQPKLARKAFEESLRWGGVVQTFFRTTSRDVQLGGECLPSGAKILLFLAAANRDPREWSDADKFDITRAVSGHVGFGFGIHQCLGQMVARLESQAVLEALLKYVTKIRVAGSPVRRPNNTLYALGSLPIELIS